MKTLAIVASITLLSLAPQDVTAQTTKLVCDGTYSDLSEGGVRAQPRTTIVIDVSSKTLTVRGAPEEFDSTGYKAVSTDESGVCFAHPITPMIRGCLNRFNGAFSLLWRVGEPPQYRSFFSGSCKLAKPLF